MSVISLKDRMITLKVVYYGPAAGGKTTSLQYIHRVLDPEETVKLVTLATAGDKTLFFDFLPVDLGSLGGFQLRVQGFTVPGQVQYALTRRYVLAGADGVVFVANSDPACAGENEESVRDFRENSRANALDPDSIPLVIQYNKRDLPDAVPMPELKKQAQFRPVPEFETVAIEGRGVFEAFRSIVGRMVQRVAREAKVDPRQAEEDVLSRLDAIHGDAISLTRSKVASSTVVVRMPDAAEPRDAEPSNLLEKAIDSGVQLSRLYAEVNVARRRLELAIQSANALNRFSRRLLGAESLEAIWLETYRACVEHVPSMSSSLLVRSEEGEPLREMRTKGHSQDPLQRSMGGRLGSFLTRVGEAAHLNERDDPEILRPIRQVEPEVRGMLIVPVPVRGDVEGAVVLYRGAGQPPFHLKDTRFLSSVANVAALGLGRALRERDIVALNRELEDRVRDRTARLSRALNEIRRLNATLEDRVQQRTADLNKANDTLRRTQDFLLQAEKMSSLARLASGIAHEINNPMSYVHGNLKALGDYVGEIQRTFRRIESALERDDPAETLSSIRLALGDPGIRGVREDLEGLVAETTEGASRVIEIAESMRKLAHIRAKDREPVDLHEQIESALSLLASKLRPGIEVERDYGELPKILGYPVLLSQVFLNVIVNAADAMEGRGTIRIRTRPEEEGARVEISDTGPGIDDDTLPHIFEPFYTTKEVGKGTGLGLYTVYQIIERHSGVVNVTSEPGKGTTFTFHLLGIAEPVSAEANSR